MALVIDTSALLCRYLPDARRRFVAEAMAGHERWIVSALSKTEVLLALHQAALDQAGGPSQRYREFSDRVRSDWGLFWEVPLDSRCMARAAELGAYYGLSVVNAIQLAAADRLPRPVEFLTLDRRQIPAAAELGFQVRSPLET